MLATYRVRVPMLPASPYGNLPDSLERVLSSRPLTRGADGMVYRKSLAETAAELGIEVSRCSSKADQTVLAAKQ